MTFNQRMTYSELALKVWLYSDLNNSDQTKNLRNSASVILDLNLHLCFLLLEIHCTCKRSVLTKCWQNSTSWLRRCQCPWFSSGRLICKDAKYKIWYCTLYMYCFLTTFCAHRWIFPSKKWKEKILYLFA